MHRTVSQIFPFLRVKVQWSLTPPLPFQSSPLPYDGSSSRLSFLKRDLTVNLNNLFKLGQEGKYRVYHNQYSTNVLALNKHQHREDHDKRRHLSHKFSLTTAAEFKWNGSIYGSRSLTVSTLRLTIIQLETNVPGPFMHPNWAAHRYAACRLNLTLSGGSLMHGVLVTYHI